MTRKEIKEMKKRWREALATPTKPLHDPAPLGEVIDAYLEGKELCEDCSRSEDCISRKAVLEKAVYTETEEGWSGRTVDVKDIEALPPVTPKPKTGHWIMSDDGLYRPICNNCGAHPWKGYIPTVEEATEVFKYCPNCGAKMESEDKE